MSDPTSAKRPLRKDDLRTFSRLLSFAKPYWWRLAVGAATSALGGGSIIAMFIAAQGVLAYILDNRDLMNGHETPAVVAAGADAGDEGVSPAKPLKMKFRQGDKQPIIQTFQGESQWHE